MSSGRGLQLARRMQAASSPDSISSKRESARVSPCLVSLQDNIIMPLIKVSLGKDACLPSNPAALAVLWL